MNDKEIKWGILSTGRIAKIFAEAVAVVDNCKVHAVGSRSMDSAKQFAEKYSVPKYYGSYEELVKDPDVDVIYIGTPHNLHFENTMMALENNKHVLCEKPFAMNRREVEMMIKKAKEKNLFLMEALWSRFLPNILKVKELVESEEIGKIQLLTAFFGFKSVNGPSHRQWNKELGGGSLLDIGIYNVFLSLFLLGKPMDITAVASMSKTEVDKTCSLTFRYEQERLAILYSSFEAQISTVAELHGEKGKIFLEHLWFCPTNIRITDQNGNERRVEFKFVGNGYNYEVEEVNKCIREGKRQSDIWSLENSIELIDTLDQIRKKIGLVYPNHD